MTADGELRYDVLVSDLAPVKDAPLPNGQAAHWSPLSHTLIHGPSSAAVVAPPITRTQSAALAEWITARGKRLKYIFITHAHGDHWLGTRELLRHFPDAVALAAPGTAQRIKDSTANGSLPQLWPALFPEQLDTDAARIAIDHAPADGFTVDGYLLMPLDVGHSDTDDTSILHVPSLGLVVAGDVVYNNVHQYLAETPNGGLQAWHKALDAVAALKPRYVVAGHKDAGRRDAPADIDATRRYLDDTARLLEASSTPHEFFTRVLKHCPDRLNPYTLWLSARQLLNDTAAQPSS
ncbi:MBL fold metallo-hydrolase [Streptomyces sp. NPDC088387]|uniref:MBL fold metallo-hydrolase n=1 Tax=Streptomyces sp. NPDC088387 TaxID=3365859 RepID=UPI0038014925